MEAQPQRQPQAQPPSQVVAAEDENYTNSIRVSLAPKIGVTTEKVLDTLHLRSGLSCFTYQNNAAEGKKQAVFVFFPSPKEAVIAQQTLDGLQMSKDYYLSCTLQHLDPIHTIQPAEINKLPPCAFTGHIIIVDHIQGVKGAIAALLGGTPLHSIKAHHNYVLGMDTESKPTFKKGDHTFTSLLQLSNSQVCVIFRILLLYTPRNPLPLLLKELLEYPHVKKVGVGVQDDVAKMNREEYGVQAQGVHDILDIPITSRCQPKSMKGLAAMFLGGRMQKNAATSNWENPKLTQNQVIYAATDAWVSRELYVYLTSIPYSHFN